MATIPEVILEILKKFPDASLDREIARLAGRLAVLKIKRYGNAKKESKRIASIAKCEARLAELKQARDRRDELSGR